jgi:hypothetical protein
MLTGLNCHNLTGNAWHCDTPGSGVLVQRPACNPEFPGQTRATKKMYL